MARSNSENPQLKMARRVTRHAEARALATRGRLGATETAAATVTAETPQTTRTGDGSEENPYRTRHVFVLGVDRLGDPDTYWADVPPEVSP